MSDKINDAGPAFPHLGLYPGADGNLHPTSLRDWFAGQAVTHAAQMQMLNVASLSAEDRKTLEQMGEEANKAAYAGIANIAYGLADAMLERRKQ